MKISIIAALALASAFTLRADTSSIAEFRFDEAAGSVADDASPSALEARLSPSAKWATGTFGSALSFGEPGACANIGPIPGLDGADTCTVFVRFRRNGSDSAKNACVVSTDNWVGRGVFLFYIRGNALDVRLRASGKGPETGISAFPNVPDEKWCSVAFVFSRPKLDIYADGKLVGSKKWDHSIVDSGVRIGSWGDASFGGFVDDFRVWKRALSAAELAELAADSRHIEIEGYQDDGTGGVRKTEIIGQAGAPLAKLTDSFAVLSFDSRGHVTSLKEKATGRELVGADVPFLQVKRDGRTFGMRRLERRNDNFVAVFSRKIGEIEFSARSFDGGWEFKVVRSTVQEPVTLDFCRLQPACERWKGDFVNAWSDEKSAVCVRSGDLYADPQVRPVLSVSVDAGRPLVGRTAYLSAGPRAGFTGQLKAMTIAAGAPHSNNGGAWAMDSDEARRSYFFISPLPWEMDRMISLAYRGGFSILHYGSWAETLGHYEPRRRQFPNGLADMKAAVDSIHAAGLKAGIHTLTACIANHDSWITPLCSTNLFAYYSYTLAEPFDGTKDEVVVNELPGPRHSLIATYTTEGNYLRFGHELMQYTGIRREKPYAFTGIRRGVLGTKKGGPYPKGMKIDYPRNHYVAFYPDPDSPLADELAARLGRVYRTCGLDEFYFDGSEGMFTRYGTDVMRHKIFKEISKDAKIGPSIEASCRNANNWWFQTRTATTDHGVWGVKRFQDWHVRTAIESSRMANFLEPQMGWWQPRVAVLGKVRGHYPDEMEYFASQNAGNDAAMSIQGVHENPVCFSHKRQLTILGWYEWPRLARAFTPEAVSAMKVPGAEFRLRQDGDGVWQLTPVDCTYHRSDLPWLTKWTLQRPAASPAALRVEPLFAISPWKSGKTVLTSAVVPGMRKWSAKGVTQTLEAGIDPEHGATVRLAARNESAEKNAAWTCCETDVPSPYLDLGKARAFGFWLKGDGSGALFNFVCRGAREYHGGISEHFVRLDFTGWRYITVALRERDGYEGVNYVWPYSNATHARLRTMVDTKHVLGFSCYLNDVAPGQSAAVEIGEVRALETPYAEAQNLAVVINGQRHALPFRMNSGDSAELEDGVWTHYGENGEPIEEAVAKTTPELTKGANALSVEGGFADNSPFRVEVTVFALGEAHPAFVDELTPAMRRTMTRETMLPFVYAPSKGFSGRATVAVRPEEEANLTIEIMGPVEKPTLSWKTGWFGRAQAAFDVNVEKGHILICRNGVDWKVVKVLGGETVAEGKLTERIPSFSGVRELEVSSANPATAFAILDLVKRYPTGTTGILPVGGKGGDLQF